MTAYHLISLRSISYTISYNSNYMSITSLCTPKKRHQFCHISAEKTSGHVRWVWGPTPGHEHGWLAVTSFFQLGLATDSFFKGKQRWKCPKGLQMPFLDPWDDCIFTYIYHKLININHSCRHIYIWILGDRQLFGVSREGAVDSKEIEIKH